MELDILSPEFSQAAGFEPDRSLRRGARRFALVRVSAGIEAPAERVFDAWLDPAIAGRWLFATASRPMTRVAIDARVRGRFRLADGNDGDRVEHRGVYVEIVRPWRLAFMLSAAHDLPATRVSVDIAQGDAPGTVELTVTQGDVPGEYATRVESRWTGMLYGLGLMLNSHSGGAVWRGRRNAR